MKRFIYLCAAMFAIGTFVSCTSHSDSKISEKEILKQVNKALVDNAQAEEFCPITIGTFDCPDELRYFLRQMEAAKLVNYDVTRYAWWERSYKNVREAYRVQRNYYWYSYYDTEYRTVKKTNYEFEDHYVVTIDLTKKGKGIAVEDLPSEVIEEDPDLIGPDVDPSKYAWNKADLSEEWPYIPNPFLEPEKESTEPAEEPVAPVEEPAEEPAKEPATEAVKEDKVDRIDALQYEKFNSLNLESPDIVYLKAYGIKAIKARNIQISNVDGIATVTAEVILATQDVTDAGRICMEVENDMRSVIEVSLSYYLDKGWVLNELDDCDSLFE